MHNYSRAAHTYSGPLAVTAGKMTDVEPSSSSRAATPALQRIFFSPHPDDVAYSAYGTATARPKCCHHDDDEDVAVPQYDEIMTKQLVAAIRPINLRTVSSFSDDTADSSSSYSSYSSSSRRNSGTHTPSTPSTDFTSDDEDDVRGDIDAASSLIVTVFSQSRCANGAIGARLARNVDATTSLRTDEDQAFARSIGYDLLQLGFPDSSARDEPSRRPDLALAAIARQQAGVSITDVDHAIYDDVRAALAPLVAMAVRAGAQIHVPLAVGCHVDHWMVRVAVLSLVDEMAAKVAALHERLTFYEDLPYADAQTNAHIEALAFSVLPVGTKAKLVHISEQQWCRKRQAILTYASQMKPTILPSLYNHATRLAQLGQLIDPDWQAEDKTHMAAERIWVVDSQLRRKMLAEQA